MSAGSGADPVPPAAPHGVRIEPMRREHIEALLVFEQEMFGSEAWTRDSYAAELADRRHRHYVVALAGDDRLLGWAGLMTVADTAQVLTIGTVPAAQRRGIGQRLLDALLAEARRRGARDVVLEVRVDNDPARRMYERNRFRVLRTRRGYYDAGRIDAVEMQLLLDGAATDGDVR